MMNDLRSEDSAEIRTVTGWICKKCNKFWGFEKMARSHIWQRGRNWDQ